MKSSARKAAIILLLAVVPTVPGKAADMDRMDQVVQASAVDNNFMGTVLVAKGDAILLDKGYGAANLEWNIPNGPTTRLRIGSLVKQFTAAAVLLLEERGKLKLTDPVKAYLPDAPAAWDNVTLFNLLTHTSGIHDYTDTPAFAAEMSQRMTPQQLIATIRDMPLDFAPSEKFNYSNSGYLLLGLVIEKASGLPYARFLQDNLFAPLGMKDSGFDDAALLPQRASGYSRNNGTIANARYMDMGIPFAGGAMYSTTHDLLTWERGLFSGKVISPQSLEKMTTAFKPASGPGAPFKGGYGLGVYSGTTEDGRREVSHTGSLPGFVSMMAAYPDDKLFVIVLSNIGTNAYADVARQVTDLAFGKTVILPSERKEISIDAKLLTRYVGRYQLSPTAMIEISEINGALYLQAGNQPKVPIFAQSDNSFFGRSEDLQADFLLAGNGPATAMILHEFGKTLTWPRMP